jgi:4-hydroxyacetophenone monooxygenase
VAGETNVVDDRLACALEKADLRVLLMVIYHMTGDEKWLSPPYVPKRDVSLIADAQAGFDAERQAEIRSAAFQCLRSGGPASAFTPDEETLHRMMGACLNERVAPEYAGMMREEMGFVSRFAHWRDPVGARRKLTERHLRVGIVGAGASGIILASNLLELGIEFVVFERAEDVGGTWREHRYPGCSVDTPNHAYSFSFGKRYAWSRYFAPREEIQDYIRGIAEEMGIRPHIRFSTTVSAAVWDEDRKMWSVEVEAPEGRETVEVNVLVSAIGQLSKPLRISISGEESFPGPLFHPMHWPDGLDFTGKRVAIVGTGATAMQIVAEIAPHVSQLTVYQRTPQWMRPIDRYHDPIEPDQQWLLKHVPFYAEWFRLTMLWRYGDGLLPTLRKDPNWQTPTLSVNATNERHRLEMIRYIEQKLCSRPDLLAKAIPCYPPYGKRILLDAGWYDALLLSNVELVSEPIDHICGNTIVSAGGSGREADILVVSTGYDVNTMTSALDVTGRGGLSLASVWRGDDPYAYVSTSVPDFPNLFIIYGPNTALAHGGSAIFMNECASRYVADFLTRMVEDEMETVDVKPDVAAEYTARIDAEHDTLVWTAPGLESYYRNSKGRVSSANPWRMVDYWRLTHEADPEHYRVTYRNGAHGNRKVESHSKAGQVDASIDRPSGIVRS